MISLKRVTAGAMGAIGLMLALTAPPQSHAQQGNRGMAACRADLATFCKGMEAGRGERLRCLLSHDDKLQPACRDALAERVDQRGPDRRDARRDALKQGEPARTRAPADQAQEAMPGRRFGAQGRPGEGRPGGRALAVCRADMQALCGDVQAGGGARLRCMSEQADKLSADCRAALADVQSQMRDRRLAAREACRADAQALCAGTRGAERRQCLVSQVERLSPACAEVVQQRPRG